MDTKNSPDGPKAETRVPIPERRKVYAYLYRLKVGESVRVPNEANYRSLRAAITYVQNRYEKRFTVRKIDSGHRVWRVK